ncbi:hypothetical protein FH972_003171 [Carpinus fangiana]|uniref:Uncharacterized protein n=1 Tax=Carpinus fangiana TaxID=176857 RepID=A0A5N6QH58_9ROSI|nr:hypothetical protein FH972_003171 [Carpinus fangiana]
MVSFRILSSFFADTKSLLSSITRCCRRSKCKYRCRVWQPDVDAIAGYVQRALASVEHPCTVHIGAAFMVTRYRRRQTLLAYVDDEELDYDEDQDEEEQAIIQASIKGDNVFGGVGDDILLHLLLRLPQA